MTDSGDPIPASSLSSQSQPSSLSSSACTCASAGISSSSPPAAHLASAIVGPTPTPISYLNEYLLAQTLHLAGALPSPSHPPLQHVMVLPSLQLLSFMVCRPHSQPPNPQFLYDDEQVVLITRDSRGKHAWCMRNCHARRKEQTGDTAGGGAAASSSPSSSISAGAGSGQQAPRLTVSASEDRFFTAWQSCAAAVPSASSSSSSSPSAAAAAESSPAASAAAASAPSAALPSASSTKSNLRNAIVSARGLPFSSSSSQSARSSHWKPASAFSLFDAQRDTNAWLSQQEATAEHQQYTAAIAQQLRNIAASPSPALPITPAARPPPPPPAPLGDGFPYLHALLHHLGFFSSLVPSSAVYGESGLVLPPSSELMVGGSGRLPVVSSSASLLLLNPSPALTAQLEQLDMIEDRRLCRILLLQRRAQQQLDTQMMRNRADSISAASPSSASSVSESEAATSALSFRDFVSLLAAASSPAHSQLQLLIPSRLCASLVPPLPTEGGEERGLFAHFLSTTPVRLVWCEDDGDSAYVPPHRQRRRDRRQWRREQERRESKGREGGGSGRLLQSSPPSSSSATMPASSSFSSASSAALIYIVISQHSGDSTFRVRIDCDHRLRSRRRSALAVDARRSQQTGGGSSASHSPIPPLLKANSLSNVNSAHSATAAASAAAAASGSSPAHLLRGLGRGLLLRLGTKGMKAASSSSLSGQFLSVGGRERSAAAPGGSSRSRDDSPSSAGGASASTQHRSPQRTKSGQQQKQQAEEETRSRQDDAMRADVRADWPPPEVVVSREELPGRVRAWLEEAVSRVDEWREARLRRRRRQEAEQRARRRLQRRKAAGGGDWPAGDGDDGEEEEEEGAELQAATAGSAGSALSARCALRHDLLRDIVREHGEFVSPALLLAACFGSVASDQQQQHP